MTSMGDRIDAFVVKMRSRMSDHPGGVDWRDLPPEMIGVFLRAEMADLSDALDSLSEGVEEEGCRKRAIREAVDVANVAMMLADRLEQG